MQAQNKRLTRQQKIEAQEQILKPEKRRRLIINSVLTVLFLGGLCLTVLEINIYRDSLVTWTLPTTIWIISGLLLTPFTSNILKKYYDTSGIFLQIVYNIGAFGGIITYSIMALNFYFPTSGNETYKTAIIKTGHLAKGRNGCGSPYAYIKLNGQEKQLIFPCDFDIENYKFIKLLVTKGFFGIDIIRDKTAITE